MPQAFYILFGAVFTIAVSVALGRILLVRLDVRLYRQEEHVLALVCGAPLLSALVFVLCSAGLARKGVFLAVGAAILILAWRSGAWAARGASLEPLSRGWKALFAGVFAVFLVLYFFNAMAPEYSPDGSTYHLGWVARYLSHHGFYRITSSIYANLSQGFEMLFLFAFAFGRHSAAALVHCAFLAALPLLTLGYARRSGFAPAGVCAALFVFASPIVGRDGTCAYNDVAVAAVVFTVFYLLQVWDAERRPGLLPVIGLVAGFGYAVKYTAAVAVIYAVLWVAWKSRHKGGWLRPALTVGLCALVPMLPWMVKNWMVVANPFSPFFNTWFPNPYVTPGFEKSYTGYFRLYEIKSRLAIPLAVTVGGQLTGILGPLFLLAPVAVGAARWSAGRQLLLAAAVFGAPYFGNIGARFLILVMPFVALAMALVLIRVRWLAPALVVAHAVLSWPSVIPRYSKQNDWRLTTVPFRAALRIQSEEEYLLSNLSNYAITRVLERRVPPDARVLTYSAVAEAYTHRDVQVVYQSTWGNLAGTVLQAPLIPEYQATWRLRFSFPRQALRRVRVVQTAEGGPDQWSVGELRVFDRGDELPREERWRLRANAQPWYLYGAFDNSPVTRWTSGDYLRPGTWLEVDFGTVQQADGVLLEASKDQYKIRLKLEGQDEAGKWKPLAAEPEVYDGPPVIGLRSEATAEIKRMGFDHFVIYDFDFGAGDFRSKPDLWNIELVEEANGGRLYRIL